MLTLLVGVRSTLADDLQAAAAEVFGKALTLCPWNDTRNYPQPERLLGELDDLLRSALACHAML